MDAAQQCSPVSRFAASAASQSWGQCGRCRNAPDASRDTFICWGFSGLISAFNTIGGVILYVLANTLFAHLHELGAPDAPTAFLRPLLSVLGIFVLAKAACGFIAGWGLMQREPWARVIALVLGFISLFNVPFGTAVGVYTLWVLLPAQSQEEYDSMVAARAA
jgi:hypothetical protein